MKGQQRTISTYGKNDGEKLNFIVNIMKILYSTILRIIETYIKKKHPTGKDVIIHSILFSQIKH